MKSFTVVFLSSLTLCCSSIQQPTPTREHPLPMCRVSCPTARSGGTGQFMFRAQHLCQGGTRWFEDFIAIGQSEVRGADGEILSAVWVAGERFYDRGSTTPQWRETGDFPKSDVEIGTCSSVVQRIVQSRATEQRGVHPGEPDPLNPNAPPK